MNNNFQSKLLSEPISLLPSSHAAMIDRAKEVQPMQRADDGVGFSHRGDYLYPQVEMVGSVAVVPIRGVIGRNESLSDLYWYGLADSALLEQQLRNVRDDAEVDLVVLDIRSPGGLAKGCIEVSQLILEISQKGKPVIAWVDNLCASAAYFYAAAADVIYANPCATVGAISSRLVQVDSSEQWEKEGLKLKLFSGGDLKNIGMKGKVWTEEEEAYLQERTNKYDSEFKAFIRLRRPVMDDQLRGQTWEAKEVQGSLVDGVVNTVEELFLMLLKSDD